MKAKSDSISVTGSCKISLSSVKTFLPPSPPWSSTLSAGNWDSGTFLPLLTDSDTPRQAFAHFPKKQRLEWKMTCNFKCAQATALP